jgi:hypothetical protein
MDIDPRLLEANDTDSTDWLAAKLTVLFDVWIAEYLKAPEIADEQLREKGLIKVADRLVEIFGENWWGSPVAVQTRDEMRQA